MKSFLLVLAISIITPQLHADDEFIKVYTLSEDIRDVVLKSPGGHPMPKREFHLTTLQADQVQALASLDDTMRSHLEDYKSSRDCDKYSLQTSKSAGKDLSLLKRVDNHKFQIEAVFSASDAKFEQNSLIHFTGDDYINYQEQLWQHGNTKSLDVYSIDLLISSYNASHPGSSLDSLKFADKEKVLNEYAENYLGTKLPSGLLMKEMAFQNMVNNSADWKATLAVAKDKLSNQQKIELVSKLGGTFNNRYNYARFEAGDKAYGEFVNIEQLLDSAKNGNPGGICRDIALAQTQVLKELGFTHNYVVAYKTLGGRHDTVITTDPATGKIIKFNYDETNESKKGSGTEVLNQDTSLPDYGLAYNIYDSNGKPVTQVPSELSQMLRETTGASTDRVFTPRNFNLTSVAFKSPYIDGSLFTGKTSNGKTLYGVSLYKNVAVNDYLTVGAGASLSKVEGNTSLYKIEQENLYLRMNAELTSPALKLGAFETKAFLGTSGELLTSNNKQSSLSSNYSVESKKLQLDGNSDLYVGVRETFKSTNQKTTVDSKVYATFYPDINHVASAAKNVAVLDSVVVKSGVSHQISDDTRALIDTTVIMKNYGASVVLKAVAEDDKRGARYVAGVATPITSNMPTFLPGGETRAFTSIEKKMKNTIFTIIYERNFDSRSNNVMVKGEVRF